MNWPLGTPSSISNFGKNNIQETQWPLGTVIPPANGSGLTQTQVAKAAGIITSKQTGIVKHPPTPSGSWF